MKKKTTPTGLRILLSFVSSLLCLLLITSTIAAMAIADVQIITTKDNLKKIISQTLFTSSAPRYGIPKLAAGAALAPASGNSRSDALQDTVVDALYDLVVGQSGDSLGVSREQIGELLEKSTVSDFLSDKIAGIVTDIYTGEVTTTLTKSEISDLLKENAKVIESIFNITVDQEKINYVSAYVDNHDVIGTIHEQVNNALGIGSGSQPTDPATKPSDPTSGSIGDSSSGPTAGSGTPNETVPDTTVPDTGAAPVNPLAAALNALRTYTSTKALVVSIAVCAILTALLFLSNWGKPFAAMIWVGSALLIASLPYLIATVLASAAPSLLSGLSGWMGIAGKIAQVAMQMVLPVSLGVPIFGSVLLVCGIAFGKLVKKKALNT